MAQNKITGRASRGRRGVAKHSSFRTERGSASIALEPRSAPTTALPQEMTAGRAIVEILKAEGVKTVYGIPGGHVLPIYDGLYDTPVISHFLVRHEQAAASMAAAYAQLTGEAAVCLVTAGPGATNLATNVAEAFVGALPMVILAGRGARPRPFAAPARRSTQSSCFGRSLNGRRGLTGPILFRMRYTRLSQWRATASRVRSISICRAIFCWRGSNSLVTFRRARRLDCVPIPSASAPQWRFCAKRNIR